MISKKPFELPPEVAREFFGDVHAYFAEKDRHKRDLIAVYQLRALQKYQGPLERKLQLSDVKELFDRLKDLDPSER